MAKKKAARKRPSQNEPLGVVSRVIGENDDETTTVEVDVGIVKSPDTIDVDSTSLESGEERGVPTIVPPDPDEVATVEEPEIPADTPPPELEAMETVTIEVPLRGDRDIGPSHVDAQLDRRQAKIIGRVQNALYCGSYRTANGKYVHSRADAVRWLIEKIGGI